MRRLVWAGWSLTAALVCLLIGYVMLESSLDEMIAPLMERDVTTVNGRTELWAYSFELAEVCCLGQPQETASRQPTENAGPTE